MADFALDFNDIPEVAVFETASPRGKLRRCAILPIIGTQAGEIAAQGHRGLSQDQARGIDHDVEIHGASIRRTPGGAPGPLLHSQMFAGVRHMDEATEWRLRPARRELHQMKQRRVAEIAAGIA